MYERDTVPAFRGPRVQEGPGQATGQVRLFWTCCDRCSERAEQARGSLHHHPNPVRSPDPPLPPMRCTLASVVYPRRGPRSRVGREGCAEGLALTSRGLHPPWRSRVYRPALPWTRGTLSCEPPHWPLSSDRLGTKVPRPPPAADARGVPSEGLAAAAGGAPPSTLRAPTCPRQGDLRGCPLSSNHQDKGRGTRVSNLSHPAASPLKKERRN